MKEFVFRLLVCGLTLTLASPALADDDSGLSPNRLKLPSGPGSLEGVGENAEPNLNMGLATYGVPFALPAGYNGFSPSLGLSYTSSGGASVVGLGWDMAVPTVERMTARGLPDYDGDDLFVADGGNELVRIPGTRYYRARFEGGFVRYEWRSVGAGDMGYWVAEFPDGRVGYFGADATGTTVPEARNEGSTGTYSYCLVEMRDVYDHRIVYRYSKVGARPYLRQVDWVFSGSSPRYSAQLTYEARPDVLNDGKSGALVTLSQRLRDVRVMVQGQQLRRYRLNYESDVMSGGLSRLSSVLTYGTGDLDAYPIRFSFAYTQGFDPGCAAGAACLRPYMTSISGAVGADFRTGDVELLDLNGDALPDAVDTRGGVHNVSLLSMDANGTYSFAAPFVSAQAGSGAMQLSRSDVQLLDLDGDGFVDMVDGLNARVLHSNGSGDWSPADLRDAGLPDTTADANLRFMDVDYDRQIDAVHLDRTGAWFFPNQGGTFASVAVDVAGLGRSFTEDGLQLSDMNGDGMVDATQVAAGAAFYWANLGHGDFSGPVEMLNLPATFVASEVRLADINGDNLADAVVVRSTEVLYALNQNGLDFGPLRTLTSADVDGDMPERTTDITVRFADMNANGSSDVVWITASGAMQFLELFPERPNLLKRIDNGIGQVIELSYGTTVSHMARDGGPSSWRHRLPHPMQVVEQIVRYDTLSNVRQTRTLRYRHGYYDGDEHQFRGFAEVEVVAAGDASVEEGLSVHYFDVGETDRYYHGLSLEVETRSGGRSLNSVVTQYRDCDVAEVPPTTAYPVRYVCPLRKITTLREGQADTEWVTQQESYSFDGYGNQTETHNLGVVGIGSGGCPSCEGRPADVQGAPCDQICRGDEQHTRTAFVAPGSNTGGRWILHAAYQVETYGVEGSPEVAQERTYYDGPDFQGLSLGQLTRGTVRRTEARREAGVAYFVQNERSRHDGHGNVLESMDANGHRRSFGYDDQHSVLLVSEEMHFDDAGHDPYGLRMEVGYAPVTEVVNSSTEWMRTSGGAALTDRRETRYAYDEYARIVGIARPGDVLATPTQEFAYELSSPVSRIITRSRTNSGAAADLESIQCFDGLGRAIQSRTLIEPGRYQVDGFKRFNAQSHESRVYQPHVRATGACDASAPTNVLFADTRYDAQGRALATVAPDAAIYGTASQTRVEYLPLRTVQWDQNDTDSTSPHANTPTTTHVDGLGRTTRLERLLRNSLSGAANAAPTPVLIDMRYDELGRPRSLIDDHGNEHWQRRDLLGRIVYVNHPDAGETRHEYDDAANVTRSTDARGVVTRMTYDEANRPLATWHQADAMGTLISRSYDICTDSSCLNPEGRAASVSYPLLDGERGVEHYAFDARGNPVGTRHLRAGRAYDLGIDYDDADRPMRTLFPSNFSIEYTRDGLGRATSIPGVIDSVSFTDRNQLAGLQWSSGSTASREYDQLQRMTSLRSSTPDGASLLDYGYRFDRGSQLLAVDDTAPSRGGPGESARYSYDSLYRLVRAQLSPGSADHEETVDYAYDTIDNIVGKTSSRAALSPVHLGEMLYGGTAAGPHALTTIGAGSDAPELWEYDAAGNVVRQDATMHEWDFMGRLTRSDLPSGESARYAYGPERQRTQKVDGDATTHYLTPTFELRDGVGVVVVQLDELRVGRIELRDTATQTHPDVAPLPDDGDGAIRASDAWVTYARSEGLLGGTAEGDAVSSLGAAARRLVGMDAVASLEEWHVNHLGTVAATSGDDGEVLTRTVSYPYGHPRWNETETPDYHYTGMERDRGTGLSYHSARYLDMRVGRWMSADPLFSRVSVAHGEAVGPYAYVANSVNTQLDPTGEASQERSNFTPYVSASVSLGMGVTGIKMTATGTSRDVGPRQTEITGQAALDEVVGSLGVSADVGFGVRYTAPNANQSRETASVGGSLKAGIFALGMRLHFREDGSTAFSVNFRLGVDVTIKAGSRGIEEVGVGVAAGVSAEFGRRSSSAPTSKASGDGSLERNLWSGEASTTQARASHLDISRRWQ